MEQFYDEVKKRFHCARSLHKIAGHTVLPAYDHTQLEIQTHRLFRRAGGLFVMNTVHRETVLGGYQTVGESSPKNRLQI